MAKKYIGMWQALNIIERLQKKEKKQYGITSVFYALNSAKAYIKKLPAADVQEVKHGEWVENENGEGLVCKRCNGGYTLYDETPYCPNCGAKMDGEEVVKKDYNPCNKCTLKGWDMPQCRYCNEANGYKYMELDIEKFMENKNISDKKDSESDNE